MSGGARNDRISDSDSDFMFPTAALASWISGSISASSVSIAFFLREKNAQLIFLKNSVSNHHFILHLLICIHTPEDNDCKV
jgi:hypothetical protein